MRYLFLILAFAGISATATAPAQAQSGGTTAHAAIKWHGYASRTQP
jgi:hypothetical protein